LINHILSHYIFLFTDILYIKCQIKLLVLRICHKADKNRGETLPDTQNKRGFYINLNQKNYLFLD
jgi:hypothetical protein